MLEKIHSFFREPVEEEYRQGTEQEWNRYLRQAHRILYAVILLSQFVMIGSVLLRKGGPFGGSARRTGYFFLYAALEAVTVVFVLLDRRLIRKRSEDLAAYRRLGTGYCAVLLCWSCGITLLDQLGGNNLTVFLYTVLMLSMLTIMKPKQAVTLFLGALVALNLLLPYFPVPDGADQTFNNLINSSFSAIFACVISVYQYRSRMHAYRDKALIDRQNRQLRAANEALAQEALTDGLTGLRNRHYMDQVVRAEFEAAQAAQKSTACLMADIDFFKQYNDRCGHLAGDRCLQEVAAALRQCFEARTNSLVRYGGEEFLVVLTECSREEALAAAEQLRSAVEARQIARSDQSAGCVTVSVGVFVCRSGEVDFEEFLKRADNALYQAKAQRRNCVVEMR